MLHFVFPFVLFFRIKIHKSIIYRFEFIKTDSVILVSVGRAVRLKNTGELGVINGVLDSETVSVYLNESGMSIAVAIEDLETPGQSQEKPGTGAFLEEHIPTETNVAIQFSDAGEGINLIFHPRLFLSSSFDLTLEVSDTPLLSPLTCFSSSFSTSSGWTSFLCS